MADAYGDEAELGQAGLLPEGFNLLPQAIDLVLRPEPEVEAVHMLDKLLCPPQPQVVHQPAPHIGGKGELAITEGPGPSQPAYHTAGIAGGADTLLALDGTEPPVDVLPLVRKEDLQPAVRPFPAGGEPPPPP